MLNDVLNPQLLGPGIAVECRPALAQSPLIPRVLTFRAVCSTVNICPVKWHLAAHMSCLRDKCQGSLSLSVVNYQEVYIHQYYSYFPNDCEAADKD